ncbi:MAG TPA: DUF1028 domain-containing protein [Kiloniellaceae bacterium]|nr:DUF1028 domain-containing protein [Kiloniellaceae bacterium]
MTFSILALERKSGAIGCAAATGNLAVGAWVLRAAARAGAVATQGMSASPLWGDEALMRLSAGQRATAVVDQVTDADLGRNQRQLAVLDATGKAAVWTGASNVDEKGSRVGEGYVIAGNWLANTEVLPAIDEVFRRGLSEEADFGQRLLDALEAGRDAGSDARGTFSAAIRIVRADRPPLDLRVDYDDDPLGRLRRLYDLATTPPYSDWARQVPTLDDPFRC